MKNQSPSCLRSFHHRPILLLLTASLCTGVFAERLVYDYDASGNRISSERVISYSRGAGSKSAKSRKYLDSLSTARITIYPNPTKGDLRIDITGVDDFEKSCLTVRSLNGTELYQLSPLDVTNEMDLTGYANGVYLFDIYIKGESTTWKIIKK